MAESTIITGQFVRISQVPASLGERILARIIDYFLLFIYILATSYILGKLNIHAFPEVRFPVVPVHLSACTMLLVTLRSF